MFYLRLFESLNRHKIRYLVIGGIAVNLHGFLRLTMDVDIAVDTETDQSSLWEKVCAELNLKPRQPVTWQQMYSATERRLLRMEKNLIAFCVLSAQPEDPIVDILFDVDETFAKLWEKKQMIEVQGIPVPVISVPDLITMKKNVGRPKDLADIAQLSKK